MSALFVLLLFLSRGAPGEASVENRVERIKARLQEKAPGATEDQLAVITETAKRCSRLQQFWAMYVGGRCYTFVQEKLSKHNSMVECKDRDGLLWYAIEDDFFVLASSYFIRDDDASKFLPKLFWTDADLSHFSSLNEGSVFGTGFWRLAYQLTSVANLLFVVPTIRLGGRNPLRFCVAAEGITHKFSGILESCDRPSNSICQHDAGTPPDSTRTNEPGVLLKQRYIYVQLKDKQNLCVTSPPNWSVRAFNPTMCARQCRSQKPECLAFNYNTRTRQCKGFSSLDLVAECDPDWTLWTRVLQHFL